MRQLKKSNIQRPFTINNRQSKEEITKEFADHFNTLLNYPRIETNRVIKDLPAKSNSTMDTITVDDIKTSTTLLKI